MGLWPYKVAGDVVPVLAMVVCRLRSGIASLILLTLAVDEGSVFSFTPWQLYRWERILVCIE